MITTIPRTVVMMSRTFRGTMWRKNMNPTSRFWDTRLILRRTMMTTIITWTRRTGTNDQDAGMTRIRMNLVDLKGKDENTAIDLVSTVQIMEGAVPMSAKGKYGVVREKHGAEKYPILAVVDRRLGSFFIKSF